MTLEPLQGSNSYISKCGNRAFTNKLEPATYQITIFRRGGLNEGKLPKKVITAEERIAEGILKWKKERTKSYN